MRSPDYAGVMKFAVKGESAHVTATGKEEDDDAPFNEDDENGQEANPDSSNEDGPPQEDNSGPEPESNENPADPEGIWNLDPAKLADQELEKLQVMVAEIIDDNAPTFEDLDIPEDVEGCIALLSKDFKG